MKSTAAAYLLRILAVSFAFIQATAFALSVSLASAETNQDLAAWHFPEGTETCRYPEFANSDEYENAYKACLAKASSFAKVTDSSLELVPSNGQTLSLPRNIKACDGTANDDCIEMRLVAWNSKRQFAILQMIVWEYDPYMIVDLTTGDKINLDGPGIFSPSGQSLAVVSGNILNEPEFDVKLISTGNHPFDVVFKFRDGSLVWSFESWIDDKTISLSRHQTAELGDKGHPYLLRLSKNKWTLIRK